MLGVTNGAVYITLKGLIDDEAELNTSVNSVIVSLVHVVKIERLQFKQPFPNDPHNTGV